MVVIFVFFLIFILEYHLSFGMINSWLEYLVRPLVLSPPIVVLVPVFKVVVADIRVAIGDADINSFIFEHPRYLSQHFLAVLLRVSSTLHIIIKYQH